jgi:hypothetical protein
VFGVVRSIRRGLAVALFTGLVLGGQVFGRAGVVIRVGPAGRDFNGRWSEVMADRIERASRAQSSNGAAT